jgi:two-component system, NarL family, invasion response regulator UvrY
MPTLYHNSLVKIAVADDHSMFRESLCALIDTWENCKVIIQATNGKQLLDSLVSPNLPDLALIDLAMPEMNGYETVAAIREIFPDIKLLAMSYFNSEEMIWRLIKCGAQGFVNKQDNIIRLKKAIGEIIYTGYFFSDHIASKMLKKAAQTGVLSIRNNLSDREITFLKYVCTEKTYKEIAHEMGLAERQTEYLRNILFERFGVTTRVGLAMLAREKGLIL